MKRYDACDLFGGKEKVAESLRRSIKENREKQKIFPEEIYASLNPREYYPGSIIEDIESGKEIPTLNLALEILDDLNLNIDEILQSKRVMTPHERKYWRDHMISREEGQETSHSFDPFLERYVRYLAIEELSESLELKM
jgi:hypothetical protein